MEMSDQYGQLPDLRHLMTRTTHFPAYPHPPDSFPSHRNLTSTPHFEMLMSDRQQLGSTVAAAAVGVGGGGGGGGVLFDFHSDATTTTPTNSTSTTTTTTTTTATNTTTTPLIGFDQMEGCIGGGDGGNGRWPRQETLTLLEIRSRLDHKFKEANQKGPLWDEVSRIMTEEHGYQRSGKKCREKFENLYKYYKKTKEGKAGRQDGKHYRFFRQLEALYGESSNPISFPEPHYVGNDIRFQTTSNIHSNLEGLQGPKLMCESLSISNSSEFDTSSAEDNDNDLLAENGTMDKMKKKKKMKDSQCLKRGGRRRWKTKIREFVDLQMKRLIETQEAWFEKMLKTLEHKEKERMSREEEWRKQEAERIDREHKFWANERAWFEARDAALMEALKKLTGKDFKTSSPPEELMTAVNGNNENQNENGSETLDSTVINSTDRWPEAEISSLIHIRTNLESRFQHSECSTRSLWEEISANMAFLGYDRTAKLCEEKWDDINKYIRRSKDCNKKRKENSKTSSYFQQLDSTYNHGGAFSGHGINQQGLESVGLQTNDGPSPSNSNAGTTVQDSCFRLLMGEGENLWMNYGVKFNRGENQ